MYPARKHTGKVGPRAVKKSPARKSNSHSSPSPKTTKESGSPLSDNGDTNATQSSTATRTSPSKAENNESPQNEESEVEATSVQGGETAMDTSVEAYSTSRDDGDHESSSKTEETAATPTKPSEEERAKRDGKKTKQKIHPFFGMLCTTVCLHALTVL